MDLKVHIQIREIEIGSARLCFSAFTGSPECIWLPSWQLLVSFLRSQALLSESLSFHWFLSYRTDGIWDFLPAATACVQESLSGHAVVSSLYMNQLFRTEALSVSILHTLD